MLICITLLSILHNNALARFLFPILAPWMWMYCTINVFGRLEDAHNFSVSSCREPAGRESHTQHRPASVNQLRLQLVYYILCDGVWWSVSVEISDCHNIWKHSDLVSSIDFCALMVLDMKKILSTLNSIWKD